MTTVEFLADVVMLAHAGFSMFVVLGLVVILAGTVTGWHWARHRWFRVLHLTATMMVVARVWLEFSCPFSAAEDYLRRRTVEACALGQPVHDALHRLAFRGEDPHRFAISTTLLGGLVLALFVLNQERPGLQRTQNPQRGVG